MILGHGNSQDKDLKNLSDMVHTEGWKIFEKWCKDYEIEVALEAVHGVDEKAGGKAFILEELQGFRKDVMQRLEALVKKTEKQQ